MPRQRKIPNEVVAEETTQAPVETSEGELSETIRASNKRYGPSIISTAKDKFQPYRISTGSFALDLALLGGVPHNRQIMIVGEKHAGKTTLALLIIASAQRAFPAGVVVFIDAEGTWDSVWAEALGVDLGRVQVVEVEYGEMGVDIACAMVETMGVSLVVTDSVAMLEPINEFEASAEDSLVGVQARLINRYVRKVTSALIKERHRGHFVTKLYLNQYRTKIGVIKGDPRTIPGGRALEASTSISIQIQNKEFSGKDSDNKNESTDIMTHNIHTFKIGKNKLNQGPRAGEFKLCRIADDKLGLSIGDIDDAKTLLAFAKRFGVYTGGGTKRSLMIGGKEHVARSAEEHIVKLYEDRELYNVLRDDLLKIQAGRLGMPESFIEGIDWRKHGLGV